MQEGPSPLEQILAANEDHTVYLDMSPLYWTPSRGGIIMRYSYEFKIKCVEMYQSGQWPETPEGIKQKNFRKMVRQWVRAENANGMEVLKHKNYNKAWTPESI